MVIDIVIGVILAWAAYRGFSKGLIYQATTLAALLLGILGAIRFSDYVAFLLFKNFQFEGPYVTLIAFVLTFFIIILLVHLVGKLLDRTIELIALGFVNRITGLLFSVLKMAFIVSVVLNLLNSINYNNAIISEEKINESKLYTPVTALAPLLFPYFRHEFNKHRDNLEPETDLDDMIV
jgi:membrane protein required for colicin V production